MAVARVRVARGRRRSSTNQPVSEAPSSAREGRGALSDRVRAGAASVPHSRHDGPAKCLGGAARGGSGGWSCSSRSAFEPRAPKDSRRKEPRTRWGQHRRCWLRSSCASERLARRRGDQKFRAVDACRTCREPALSASFIWARRTHSSRQQELDDFGGEGVRNSGCVSTLNRC